MDSYQKGDLSIKYHIIHKKMKNTYFRIKDDYVQITTNMYTSKKQILLYLDEKFEKFYLALKKHSQKESDSHITLWGTTYHFIVHEGRFSYEIHDDTLIVYTNKKEIIHIKKTIYQHEMLKKIKEIHPQIVQVIRSRGLYQLPIKLKYLKSKFGSYHRKHHEITLNTFLATLPDIYLTYVIYHEYAHAIVFNHSKDFYNLLSELMPNHRIYQKDLKKIAII